MKRKISLILASLLVLSCLILPVSAEGSIPSAPAIPTTGAVWDGTTEEFTSEDLVQIGDLYYYEISNAEQLAFLAETGGDWLTYNYILTTNIILNDVKLEWDADGTLTTENVLEWTPIYDFKGIFDGAGYTISGGVRSLFRVFSGTLKNLNVVNCYTNNSDIYTNTDVDSVGGIVGILNGSGSITGCTFDGCVTGGTRSSKEGNGGIVGQNESGGASITNCINYGMISGDSYCGGIVGYSIVSVFDCKNYGDINSTEASAGGIAGYMGGDGTLKPADLKHDVSINECENYGDITAAYQAGGIFGKGEYTWVRYCRNYGDVISTLEDCYAGGISGYPKGALHYCENYGKVTGSKAGGIAGDFTPFNIGETMFACENHGEVNGGTLAGGLAARGFNISKSVNRGNVKSGGDAGGILGAAKGSGTDGNITCCYNLGSVTAVGNAGGIISEVKTCTITQCYNAGAVTGSAAGAVASATDHIWGHSTLTDIYYLDRGLAAFPGFSDKEGVVQSRTEAQLKSESGLPEFDFENIWVIDGTNGGFPHLAWEDDLPEVPELTGISISATALTIAAGDRTYLTASVTPAGAASASFTWESDDEDVCTVNAAGRVTAVGAGEAVITVSCGGFEASCEVTVTAREDDEFLLGAIVLRDGDGNALDAIPETGFTATVPVTASEGAGDMLLMIAAYDDDGKMVELLCAAAEDLPEGSTIKLTMYFKNAGGRIAEVRAYPVSSAAGFYLLGGASSY